MSDYIKREDAQKALVHTLKDAEIDTACNEQGWYCQGLMDAGLAIDAVPSADVVEVVRCKDCMWWTKQEDSLQGRCTLMQSCPTGAWYCMNGERKDNE